MELGTIQANTSIINDSAESAVSTYSSDKLNSTFLPISTATSRYDNDILLETGDSLLTEANYYLEL